MKYKFIYDVLFQIVLVKTLLSNHINIKV